MGCCTTKSVFLTIVSLALAAGFIALPAQAQEEMPEIPVEPENDEEMPAPEGPCFIATAAYGSPLSEEVFTLRRFRDDYLATNSPGRAATSAYYALSPAAAEAVEDNAFLRTAARLHLAPVVRIANLL